VDGQLSPDDLRVIESARLDALMVLQTESSTTIEHLKRINPGMFIAVRIDWPQEEGSVDPGKWVEAVQGDVGRLYQLGIRYFAIHTKPNLQSEGWRRNWHGGREFGTFFSTVARKLRELYPDVRIGFPELSGGDRISGWQESWLQFISDAEEAIDQSDWLGVSCHWQNAAGMRSLDEGRLYEQYLLRFPEKLLFITEYSNASEDVLPQVKAEQYLEYYRRLKNERTVGAAFGYAISASGGYDSVLWRGFQGTDFISRIAERSN
jgi:hypothetical protein